MTLLHWIKATLLVVSLASSALYLLVSISGTRVDKSASGAQRRRFMRIGPVNREDAKKFIRHDFVITSIPGAPPAFLAGTSWDEACRQEY